MRFTLEWGRSQLTKLAIANSLKPRLVSLVGSVPSVVLTPERAQRDREAWGRRAMARWQPGHAARRGGGAPGAGVPGVRLGGDRDGGARRRARRRRGDRVAANPGVAALASRARRGAAGDRDCRRGWRRGVPGYPDRVT